MEIFSIRVQIEFKNILHYNNVLTNRESVVDKEMLENENVLKILNWASFESRIHLLDQLVKPELAFLWIRPKERISTKIDVNIAGKISKNIFSRPRSTKDKY